MNENEKERPAASGIEEVFAQGAVNAAPIKGDDHDAADNAQGDDGQSKRRDRNHRRGRRRGRGGSRGEDGESAAPSTEQDETLSTVPKAEESEELVDIDPDDVGVGGFGMPGKYTEYTVTTRSPDTVEVVGVRFKDTGKTYYFKPSGNSFDKGTHVIVDTSRGLEYGSISVPNTIVPVSAVVPPLRSVVRRATEADEARYVDNGTKEKEAFNICLEKIREHELEMKLIAAEYTFDQSKLTFYFSAEGRVDFRELVKDLAGVFRTRIELRQIGIRDEAKLVGGLGVCGRPFCCSTFLSDFAQVSIKMAKEQNLSLNSTKISGSCGRLMCCLRFEHDTYAEELKVTPPVGSRVKTADGIGVVTETAPLRGKIKVRLGDENNQVFREFDRSDVTVLPKNKPENKQPEPEEETEAE